MKKVSFKVYGNDKQIVTTGTNENSTGGLVVCSLLGGDSHGQKLDFHAS